MNNRFNKIIDLWTRCKVLHCLMLKLKLFLKTSYFILQFITFCVMTFGAYLASTDAYLVALVLKWCYLWRSSDITFETYII